MSAAVLQQQVAAGGCKTIILGHQTYLLSKVLDGGYYLGHGIPVVQRRME